MDQKDRKILRIIQGDAGLSMHDLAERCAMSKTAVWRRVRALEESGVIRKRVTLLDREALGFGLTVFALVRTNQHSDAWFSKFSSFIEPAAIWITCYESWPGTCTITTRSTGN